jgi:hypothetical protein
MKRITRLLKNEYQVENDKIISLDNGFSGEAIGKLAVFENIYENLEVEQNKLSEDLEKLRIEGKTNSYKFKELMAKKLSNNFTISLFKAYGL